MNIARIMIPKVSTLFLHEKDTVRQGLERFMVHGYTAIPVLNEQEQYIGSVTEGDFLRHLLTVRTTDLKEQEQYRIGSIVRRDFCPALLVGVSLAFVGNLDGGGTKGNTMALASSIFYAGVFFLSKDKSANPLESLFIGNLCYLIFVPAMLTNQAVRGTTSSEWVFLLVFATLTGIAAWLCFAAGIKHTSALQASFITISEPVMAPIWTFVFLHETITPLAIVGCVIVIATLLTYNLKAARTCS